MAPGVVTLYRVAYCVPCAKRAGEVDDRGELRHRNRASFTDRLEECGVCGGV